ncbi:MAG: twin-arginine translocation signal domain-containing protein, partial [Gemmataceae bacterium]|nr:twin-arginine translocation signal domain-containing protein [Gemmataceae bacterium]
MRPPGPAGRLSGDYRPGRSPVNRREFHQTTAAAAAGLLAG